MKVKVFISWSGDLSKQIAQAIREWLPQTLQFVEPYFTPNDVEKGTRWSTEIAGQLNSTDLGIFVMTRENLAKPWIVFEAGALSKNIETSRAWTVLFDDLVPTDIVGPLELFQHTLFEREDFEKLIFAVNKAADDDTRLDDRVVSSVFDMWWPKLEAKVAEITNDHQAGPNEGQIRSERELLEEVLLQVREMARNPKRPDELDFHTMVKLSVSGPKDEKNKIIATLNFLNGIRVVHSPLDDTVTMMHVYSKDTLGRVLPMLQATLFENPKLEVELTSNPEIVSG